MGAAKPRMGAAEVRMGAAEIGHAAVLLLRLEQDPLEGAAVDVETQREVGAIVLPVEDIGPRTSKVAWR